jgi:hypothetical protein
LKSNYNTTAKAEELAAAASRTAATAGNPTDGRLMGFLSIAASPGAILISPTLFSVGGFFLAMLGLTLAAPKQRIYSFIGIALAIVCGGIGYYFKTPII